MSSPPGRQRLPPLFVLGTLATLYASTMYPDVVASGDIAKFQYIGAVLGTPHPPGYPFYMLLSHAWSWLPVGTLAWRMNALSVAAALLAAACVFAAARRLGAGPWHAALVAAACGTGRTFWDKSLAAEVYSIGAALVAAATWRVLVWRETRRLRDLLMAVAILALGLGNHLTIATLAPAFVVFVLAVDRTAAVTWRAVSATALLIAMGLSQYGYILWRTARQSPHLEASARSLGELFDVMRASRYEGDMFASGWRELLGAPLESLVSLLGTELGLFGTLAIAAALIHAFREAWRPAVLLGGSALGVLLLSLNVRADTGGFIVAALPPLWLLAALTSHRRSGSSLGRSVSAAVALLLAAAVGTSVWTNFRYVDHSDRTIERRLWTAVLETVPDGTRVVAHSYVQDQSLLYLLHGEGVRRRDIAIVSAGLPAIDRAFRDERRTVIAFKSEADEHRRSGLEYERLPLLDSPVPALVGASRRDRFAIVAVQPHGYDLLAAQAPGWTQTLGGRQGGRRARHVLVGLARGTAQAVPEQYDDARASLSLPAGTVVGGAPLPVSVEADAGGDGIRIRVDGREVLRTPAPLAVVVLGEGGQVRRRLVPASASSLRPPLETPVFRLVRSVTCADIGDRRWHDTTRVADSVIRVRLDNYRNAPAQAVLYLGADQPIAVRLVSSTGTSAARLSADEIPRPAREDRLAEDGVGSAPALRSAPHVTRVVAGVDDEVDIAVLTVSVSVRPTTMFARGSADRVAAPRVRLCR